MTHGAQIPTSDWNSVYERTPSPFTSAMSMTNRMKSSRSTCLYCETSTLTAAVYLHTHTHKHTVGEKKG